MPPVKLTAQRLSDAPSVTVPRRPSSFELYNPSKPIVNCRVFDTRGRLVMMLMVPDSASVPYNTDPAPPRTSMF